MIRPQNNASRVAISLSGIWRFGLVDDQFKPGTYHKNWQKMAVPASFNELVTDGSLRDYVGVVCYEREVSFPINKDKQFRLYFEAVAHQAKVYWNGVLVGRHRGGFLPFEIMISASHLSKNPNLLQVLVDTKLDTHSLPIGEIQERGGKLHQEVHFDFFPYAGIHRDVFLCIEPVRSIRNIEMVSDDTSVTYQVDHDDDDVFIQIVDAEGKVVLEGNGARGVLRPSPIHAWSPQHPVLYQMIAKTDTDEVRISFGFRKIEVHQEGLFLNGEPIFLKGFGKHEDFPILGKGNNSAVNIRDMNLMRWIHANSFRTSHYPYSEEIMDLADQMGFLVIDEVPAVGMNFWNSTTIFQEGIVDDLTLDVHQETIRELVERDRHHPSVIMLSLSNEANTHEEGARSYFETLVSYTRSITNLPLINVEWVGAKENKVADLFDVIGVNRYFGWYTDIADLEIAATKLADTFESYWSRFHKPIILTEFGADTIEGAHRLPETIFSEEFQVKFLDTYRKVVQKYPYVVGEHVWNFADFMTQQGLTRVLGNRKGVFTRDRQPKAAAFYLRDAWK